MQEKLSLSDTAVLAALGEGPAHGFKLAGLLSKAGDLGGIWAVQRPQVYRALEHLERLGYAAEVGQTLSLSGPPRTLYALTPQGSRTLQRWLETPVTHLRDTRHELLLKLVFLERRELEPQPLLHAQTEHFRKLETDYRARLEHAGGAERLALEWRLGAVRAALEFLAQRL